MERFGVNYLLDTAPQLREKNMDLFVLVEGQQRGPFPLQSLREMRELGSLGSETLVWSPESNSWTTLDDYLLRHPLATSDFSHGRKKKEMRKPSVLLGLLGAFGFAVTAGAMIAGLFMLIGALFSFSWWAMAWGTGMTAKACGRTSGGLMGLFAFAATFLGIMISCMPLSNVHTVSSFGGLGMLISLPGSLWFAFRTASTPD